MTVSEINGLKQEQWAENPVQIRLNSLQELETSLAAQENRDPSVVRTMFDDGITSGEFKAAHTDENGVQHDNTIFVNAKHLANDNPYQAVETLFHESRHAYQEHLVNNPDQASDPTQLEEWKINNSNEGYLNHEVWDYDVYRWQPIEADANRVARERTDQLYGQQFADPEYENFRQTRESQIAAEIEAARSNPMLGENYEEAARDLSYYQYNQVLSETQESQAVAAGEQVTTQSPAPQPQEEAIAESAEQVPGQEVSEAEEEESQDQDYYRGYGY